MWFFSRKYKILDTPFFEGFKDFHNHTLPSVDDGVQSMEESLAVLSYFEQLKISEVVLTPHVMIGVNDSSELVEGTFDTLTKSYKGSIKLSLASEYMLDSNFLNQFSAGARMIEETNLLVETSYFSAPRSLNEMLYEVSAEGVTPIIAHPERYLYMPRDKYTRLKDSGCSFQLNLLSFSGAYGDKVSENALYLLEQGMYNVMGTDLHSLESFRSRIAQVKLSKKHIDMLLELKEKGL